MDVKGARKTLLVALSLCVVCSVLVSSAAVLLRPAQEKNRRLDIRKKLLLTAGLIDSSEVSAREVEEAFAAVEAKVIDFATGEEAAGVDAASFDQRKAAKDGKMNLLIPGEKDFAKIKRRSRYGKVYLVKKEGRVAQIILPVSGKGLWSTLHGFISLSPDTRTVLGFGHYEHGETPGLGGEVDNPAWKKQWEGKKILDEDYRVIIDVLKGRVNPNHPAVSSQIDGLAGATITANSVEASLKYWLGEHGFGPFLVKMREGFDSCQGSCEE